jgi:hypothetical protein
VTAFEAQHPGHCHACDERIVPGEEVLFNEDNEPIHAVCLAGEDEPQRNERHCADCHLVHAGKCP